MKNRNEIVQKFTPLSVDMESASIAHVCYVNQIPFLSIRTITDTEEHKEIENLKKTAKTLQRLLVRLLLKRLKKLN